MWRRHKHNGRHWAPPDPIPDGDQVLHPAGRRSADILREVLEEPTQVVPALRPLMTLGQQARSSGADIMEALNLHLPWSGWCWAGYHDRCDGSAPPADRCHCPHQNGHPVP
jgi:hypothetical protein